MVLKKPHFFAKSVYTLRTTTSRRPTTLNWRTEIKQNQLVHQISSILLQRHNWPQLLRAFDLSSKLNPPLFQRILQNTQNHPQITLKFFNWAVKNVRFEPDLQTNCILTLILFQSGITSPARPILESLIEAHPPIHIVQSLITPCKGTDFDFTSQSLVIGSVIDRYCRKGLYFQALEVLQKAKSLFMKNERNYMQFVTVHSCNTLLNVLQEKNEFRLALCFYGFMLRSGVLWNQSTWDLLARILRKYGRIGSVVRIIEMGVYDHLIYDLVIECYSERGNFEVALNLFDEMCKRKLKPRLTTYASILDGACRFDKREVISMAMDCMVERGYISKALTKYDLIIQRLCSMRKTYAANMLFKQAFDEKIALEDDTYGYMLKAFSEEGRTMDAIEIYRVMEQKGIRVKDSSYDAFTDVLSKEEPSVEVSRLLIDMISRGYSPSPLGLSKYITFNCNNGRWEEAEELVNLCLEKSLSPEASCFSSLVEHYCRIKRIDLAISLHDKLEGKDQTLDVSTYNVLLDWLTRCRRVQEAERVLFYMRQKNLLSSESLSIMITALCHENELRKAMKLHDEMLVLGLKPHAKTYKRLISHFK